MIFVNLHEAPRELGEGLALWFFGLQVGRMHLRKHLVKPAEERHAEVMQAHKKVHEHLGIQDTALGIKEKP